MRAAESHHQVYSANVMDEGKVGSATYRSLMKILLMILHKTTIFHHNDLVSDVDLNIHEDEKCKI